MTEIRIASGYIPGSIGRVAELHGSYYYEHWKFGLFFEARVAVELSEFLKRFDERRDGFWTARVDGRMEGSIAIDGIHAESEGAHLRWFIVSDAIRGERGRQPAHRHRHGLLQGQRLPQGVFVDI